MQRKSQARRLLENDLARVPNESGGRLETNTGAIRPFFLARFFGKAVAAAPAAAPVPPLASSPPGAAPTSPPPPPSALFRRVPLKAPVARVSPSFFAPAGGTAPDDPNGLPATDEARAGALAGAPVISAVPPAARGSSPVVCAVAAAAAAAGAGVGAGAEALPSPSRLSFSAGATPFVMLLPSRMRVGRDRISSVARVLEGAAAAAAAVAVGPAEVLPEEPRLAANAVQKLAHLDCFTSRWVSSTAVVAAPPPRGTVATAPVTFPPPLPPRCPSQNGAATGQAAGAGGGEGEVGAGVGEAEVEAAAPRAGPACGSASQRVTGPSAASCPAFEPPSAAPSLASAGSSQKQLGSEDQASEYPACTSSGDMDSESEALTLLRMGAGSGDDTSPSEALPPLLGGDPEFSEDASTPGTGIWSLRRGAVAACPAAPAAAVGFDAAARSDTPRSPFFAAAANANGRAAVAGGAAAGGRTAADAWTAGTAATPSSPPSSRPQSSAGGGRAEAHTSVLPGFASAGVTAAASPSPRGGDGDGGPSPLAPISDNFEEAKANGRAVLAAGAGAAVAAVAAGGTPTAGESNTGEEARWGGPPLDWTVGAIRFLSEPSLVPFPEVPLRLFNTAFSGIPPTDGGARAAEGVSSDRSRLETRSPSSSARLERPPPEPPCKAGSPPLEWLLVSFRVPPVCDNTASSAAAAAAPAAALTVSAESCAEGVAGGNVTVTAPPPPPPAASLHPAAASDTTPLADITC